jgi:hypothetical protein
MFISSVFGAEGVVFDAHKPEKRNSIGIKELHRERVIFGFMEPGLSFQYPHQSTTKFYLKPQKSSPHTHRQFLKLCSISGS